MHVNAYDGTKSISQSFTVTLYPDSSSVSKYTGWIQKGSYTINLTTNTTSGIETGHSGYINPYNAGSPTSFTFTNHDSVTYFSCPLSWDFNPLGFGVSNFDSNYDYVAFSTWSLNVSPSVGSFNDISLTFKGDSTNNYCYANKNSINYNPGGGPYYSPTLHLGGYFNYALPVGQITSEGTSQNAFSNPITFTVTVTFQMYMGDVSANTVSSNSPRVNDIKGNELQQQNNDLQTQGNTLQQQNNTIAQDTNTTSHGILNKITDFFNSFFDSLIGVFVPESGFFQQWFSDLNSFLSQKLGFLWSPFDFVISFLNGIYSSSGGSSPGIVFPGLTWIDGTVIIPQQTFSFDNIGGESFSDLRDMIYFATDVILLGAVVHQFYQKIKIVFEGGSD